MHCSDVCVCNVYVWDERERELAHPRESSACAVSVTISSWLLCTWNILFRLSTVICSNRMSCRESKSAARAAVVAAPIRKLWPLKWETSTPAETRSQRIPATNAGRDSGQPSRSIKNGPGRGRGMDIIGQDSCHRAIGGHRSPYV